MRRAEGVRDQAEQLVDVAWTLPRPVDRVRRRVGERWVQAVQVPVQAAEGARHDGARAARAARAGMAEDGVAFVVFEAKVVDLLVVLSVRCVNKATLQEKTQ